METKANFVLMGIFTLAVMFLGLGFVWWFQAANSHKDSSILRVVFEGAASGLRTGASVNFNGIRIGEVISVKIDDPKRVVAILNVDRQAPVREDTAVGLEFQGLTGIAAVSLKGGSVEASAVPSAPDGIPTLTADSNATKDVTETARAVLQNINQMVADNQEAFGSAMKGFDSFVQTLARNGERIDGFMIGIDVLINKQGTGEFQEAARSFRELGDNLDKRSADVAAGINKFTSNSSRDITALTTDGRKTLADISRAVNNFDQNPSRLLFGGAGAERPPQPQAPAPAPARPTKKR